MKKIIVIGSSNIDMVVRTSHLPAPGETILGGEFFMNQGGKGANQAVAVKRLGGNLIFVAKLGNDILGQQSVDYFKKEGIDTKYITLDENSASGVALISVDDHAENSIVVASGANMLLNEQDVDKVVEEMCEGTLGSKGCLVREGDTSYCVDAFKVEPVDTTAAGDTFNGALCVGLAEGMNLRQSAVMASKASSVAVTRMGAQSSIPHRKELDLNE